MRSSDIYAAAFARMWAERHDDRVHVFANGHVFDKAARRASIRQNIGCQRRYRQAGD